MSFISYAFHNVRNKSIHSPCHVKILISLPEFCYRCGVIPYLFQMIQVGDTAHVLVLHYANATSGGENPMYFKFRFSILGLEQTVSLLLDLWLEIFLVKNGVHR